MRENNEREYRRLVQQSIAERTGTVTLMAGAASTAVVDARIRFDSPVVLIPTTGNAAAEIGNGTLWISDAARRNGTVTIVHANNAQVDRTYRYLIG